MRLDDLRFFVRVALLKNLSAAGREFGLSPSAASARLVTLEKSVGSQLMSRTTRSIALTEAGQIFKEHALAALKEIDVALCQLDEKAEEPSGSLRISCNMFFGRKHILPYLNEFRDRYPKITLEMSFSDRLVDLIAEGYDLAVRGAKLPDSTLRARKLAGNPRVLCASPEYIARKGEPKTPDDLNKHEFVGVSFMPYWYFEGPKGEITFDATSSIMGDSGDYAYDAALYGMGLTVKSVAHVWEDLRDGRLVELMTDYPVARSGEIWAVYPPGNFTPPKITAFIDFLRGKYGSPPYWETDYREARSN
ncbi:LysR family transcriptional regulator [Kiloniella litopenaei]|uniref:LysR family transcriptional regulator n=1 Tax=Kiloniella litopenaei TaxID=1549748 RepID=A0A0M2RD52_9PROT|nr:LysR family transcriptional regulator [Kiloniella litopenaei]KKJ78379.1 LysR family transcriptional regulator [Kiloniella litopenaei]